MWLYNNKTLNNDDIPDKAIGFIYLIKNNKNNMFYIGKKLLTKVSYKTVNKKKIKTRKESDWLNYWSSSKELKEDVLKIGKENFIREILVFCYSRSELNYIEEKLQYQLEVLENNSWYNSNIRARIFKKNIYMKTQSTKDILNKITQTSYL